MTHIYYLYLLGGAARCGRYRAQVKMFCHFDSLSLIYTDDAMIQLSIHIFWFCFNMSDVIWLKCQWELRKMNAVCWSRKYRFYLPSTLSPITRSTVTQESDRLVSGFLLTNFNVKKKYLIINATHSRLKEYLKLKNLIFR